MKKAAIIKNKGTPNLLNSSDNIDGTQTFLTPLSAVKLESIEKRGKIQTTKMTTFSHLNICSRKKEPNQQWPLTATIGLNFLIRSRFTYPNDLPLTSNGLCKAVTHLFPSSWPEQYWSDQREGNPMLQIKKMNFWLVRHKVKVIGVRFPFTWNEALGSPLFDQTSTTQIKKKGTY